MPAHDGLQPHWVAVVVPLGFEPRSEEPESSMMDRYTKGLLCWRIAFPSSIQRFERVVIKTQINLRLKQSGTAPWKQRST